MSVKDFIEKDYYAALGVPKNADPDAIKKAYRKLAVEFHPDKNKGDAAAEERFKEISEAHSVLSDPARRAEYDEVRATSASGGYRAPNGGAGGFRGEGVDHDILVGPIRLQPLDDVKHGRVPKSLREKRGRKHHESDRLPRRSQGAVSDAPAPPVRWSQNRPPQPAPLARRNSPTARWPVPPATRSAAVRRRFSPAPDRSSRARPAVR